MTVISLPLGFRIKAASPPTSIALPFDFRIRALAPLTTLEFDFTFKVLGPPPTTYVWSEDREWIPSVQRVWTGTAWLPSV